MRQSLSSLRRTSLAVASKIKLGLIVQHFYPLSPLPSTLLASYLFTEHLVHLVTELTISFLLQLLQPDLPVTTPWRARHTAHAIREGEKDHGFHQISASLGNVLCIS